MGRFLRSIIIVHLFLFTSISVADFPGVMPGSFSVTDSGSASYTLPIKTPAGVNGMSPSLAVSYNSSGSNGLMGVGFQLSGFSSGIQRCGGSHATDGKATGVTYTNSDKLCMDGQRLILIKGTAFTNTAEYRTEIDSFSRIVYQNGIFRVHSRDGELALYGWKVQYNGVVKRWLKSSVHDRNNNIVRYYYKSMSDPNFGTERWVPWEVRWTGKGSDMGNRKVVFSYKTRPDKRISYEYGLKYAHNNLIDKVTTYIASNKISEYRFAYAKSPVSGLSRLRYVWQCGSAVNGCFPKHEFQWKDTAKGFEADKRAYHLPVKMLDYQDQFEVVTQSGDFVDVNNDGRVDYVVSYKSNSSNTAQHAIYENTGTEFKLVDGKKPPTGFVMRDYTLRKKNIQQGVYADVNGDGYPDIVRSYSVVYINGVTTKKKEVWINNRNFSWSKSNTFVPPSLLWTYSAGWGANRNTDSDTDQFNFRDPYLYTPMTKGHLVDVNGDGLVDWVQSYKNFQRTPRRGVWLNNGTRWVAATGSNYQIPAAAVFDDFWEYNSVGSSVTMTQLQDVNGDGLVDLVQAVKYNESPNRTLRDLRNTWLNTGSGWTLNTKYKLPDFMLDYTQIGGNNSMPSFSPQSRGNFVDVNGDGLVDWVQAYTDNKDRAERRATWLNNGNGWTRSHDYTLKGDVINNYHPLTGHKSGYPSGSFFDINRDGLADWVVAYKYKDANRNTVTKKETYLNTGSGWRLDNSFIFPDILFDRTIGWEKTAVVYGGIMDVNSDGAIDYLMSSDNIFGTPVVKTYLGKAKPADLVNKIINTMGAETGIIYKPMNDPRVYSNLLAESAYTLRKLKVNGPVPLVSDTSQSNGVGGKHWLKYHYYQALSDSKRGYSGFAQRRVWDSSNKIQSIKDFYQEFPASGMTKRELTYKVNSITAQGWLGPNPELLNYKIHFIKRVSDLATQGSVLNYDRLSAHPSGKYSFAPKIRRVRTSEYEVGQKHFRSSWVDTVYDAYSNPTQVTTAPVFPFVAFESINWTNNFWKRTTTQYSNNTSSWLIGLPTDVAVRHHAPGQTDQTRTTKMIYNGFGQPTQVIVEPAKTPFKVTTTHSYDGFGNQTSSTVSGTGITSRTSTITYDTKGLHVTKKTNALGHTMTIVPDPLCDAPKSTTDANGLTTSIIYDQTCREYQINHPNGTWTRTHYPNHLKPYKMTQVAKNQPDVVTYFDELGRDTKMQAKGFDGRLITTEKRYNSKGQITRESLPYYAGGSKYWTKFEYDVIGRLKRTINPDNSISSITYNGLTTINTNAKGQTQTTIIDLLGRIKTVRDAYNKPLTYSYDAVGNLIKTRDPKGNEVKMGYDHAGRKIWMDDPDMGRWTYDYDVLGQLIKQTNAKNEAITTEFDKLGRMTKRVTAEGTSTWEYDTATNGIGKLSVTMDASGYKRLHQYDTKARPTWTHETINNVTAKSLTTYNANGKLNSIYYPGRANSIAYSYNSLGYLTKIYDYDHNGGNPIRKDLWVLEDMDAKGNVTQERYGNGVNVSRNYHPLRNYVRFIDSFLGSTPIQRLQYDMDSIGNLTSRHNRMTGTQEEFKYDKLNRLTENKNTLGTFSLDPVSIYSYRYDELGNLIFRSDVGDMHYGQNGHGPHAVTSIVDPNIPVSETVFNPRGNYQYDANGNLTRNGPRKIFWTSFNKPKRMETTIGGNLRKVSYSYGTDFQRIYKYDSIKRKSMRYFGGGSVERTGEGGKTHWKYYIPVGATTLEIKYKQTGSNATPTLTQVEKQYLFKDHLGSTDVIVNDAGNIVERLSFNPWGERRKADWTEADSEIVSSSTRGFTGHEMDDEIGLVNMKARIYDPVIGRFLSPDSLIPSPTDLQSYNRYSYVRNNPLSFTDPTGFERISVPGRGGYKYDTDTGKFLKPIYETYESECGDGGNTCTKTRFVGYEVITDAGLISHLSHRIGVANDIIKNHGGLSRGNVKEVRDQSLSDARSAIGCSTCSAGHLANLRNQGGQSAAFNTAMDRYGAAADIYVQLKRNARKRYTKLAFSVVASAITMGASVASNAAIAAGATAGTGAALTSTQLAILYGGSSLIISGGDVKAALVAAASAGYIGPEILAGLEGVQQVVAHGVWGGVSSEILGGGFVEGFAGAAVGKAITSGFNSTAGYSQGEFHWDQFAATVAGGGAAAYITGGDPALGAGMAAMGYMINQLVPRIVPAPPSLGLPRGTMLPKSKVEAMVKHQNQVKNSVPSTRSPHLPPSNSNSGKQSIWEKIGSAIEEYLGSGAGVTTSQCPQGIQCT